MRLVTARLRGYKRFVDARINVDGKVISILGPNEAGKTSVLRALTRLNAHEDQDLALDEYRHRQPPPKPESMIEGCFLLDKPDLEAISEIPGTSGLRWFIVHRYSDGSLRSRLDSPLKRELAPRKRAAAKLSEVANSPWVRQIAENTAGGEMLKDELLAVLPTLESEAQELSGEALNELSLLNGTLQEQEERPKYVEAFMEQLHDLWREESGKHPDRAARETLTERLPEFLMFGEADRGLASEYNLAEVAGDPPPALANLAALADLSLRDLHRAVVAGDYGTSETLVEEANENLNSVFREAWKQSEIRVRLTNHEQILRIVVSSEGSGFTSIADRSDGLRTFVALVAFTRLKTAAARPVLLVDEAENHLHYDAQADLVRMMSRQQQAAQVIYTTHSIGCLPEDLGSAVRVVTPVAETDESVINDAFWTKGAGFSPLVLAMGASTMALVPTRHAVIAEGASELIMLPTLLREVLQQDHLGFQVAPGLAEVSRESLPGLELEAPMVAYVVDRDKPGRTLAARLTKSGVAPERIVTLSATEDVLVLEDFLHPGTYVQALNEELRRSHGDDVHLNKDAIGSVNRPKKVEEWCRERDIGVPNKRAVAQRVIELRSERKLVDPARRKELRALHDRIIKALGL